jgi:predicted glycogen debranching enzyme
MEAVQIHLSANSCRNFEVSSRREWILALGNGGYAMGTVAGVNTRRYHGLLVADFGTNLERRVMLAALEFSVLVDGQAHFLSAHQYAGTVYPDGYLSISSFDAEPERVTWSYTVQDLIIEREVRIGTEPNSVEVVFRNRSERPISIQVRPLTSDKPYHANFYQQDSYPQAIKAHSEHCDIENQGSRLRLDFAGGKFEPIQGWYYRFEHTREHERGLDARDDLYCPGEITFEIEAGAEVVLKATATHVDETTSAVDREEFLAQPVVDGAEKELQLLREWARIFVIRRGGRATVIAGYPWFTDWARDTMIALPGLLHAGISPAVTREILMGYADAMNQGLIPNRFNDQSAPEYNSADATWLFFNACWKSLEAEWDEEFARQTLGWLSAAIEAHESGSMYGIKIDPNDQLITQGDAPLQLTWMDAKIGDWVVTPRHGKAIEINAAWFNSLQIGKALRRNLDLGDCPDLDHRVAAIRNSFESKFFRAKLGYYLDTVDPDDATLRPNQLLAMSLPFPIAAGESAKTALEHVERYLYTPMGIRTLSPLDANYCPRYEGALSELDAAYHQGTVWPWLLGPYVTALVRLRGDRATARKVVRESRIMNREYGLGGIAEVYDADMPQYPHGCPWQAWSICEIIRAWCEDVLHRCPSG